MKVRTTFVALSVVVVAAVVALASGAVAQSAGGFYRLVGVFSQVVSMIRTSYVEQVPLDRLELGAMAGVVESGDPGGLYVPGDMASEYTRVRARALPPFGLVLGKRSSYPVALEVLPGSPASQAGIVAGELIERVNEDGVRARPLWFAAVRLERAEQRGSASLDVIDRQLRGKRLVTLKAAPVKPPVVTVELKAAVPVLTIPVVDKAAPDRVETSLEPYSKVGSVVVDLRAVALGSPDGATEVAAQLAGGDVELRLARRDGKDDVFRAKAPARSWRLIVLIDPTTAGPGELLALCLKKRGATLVGLESFGDTGQRSGRRGAGGEVWLAQSWALGLDAKPLLGTGLKPDELVRPRRDADSILERALELAGASALKQAA